VLIAWAAPEGGQLPPVRPSPCPSPRLHPGKILIVIKCLPQERCDLLKVIFARSVIFSVAKYSKAGKFAAYIERPKAKSVSASSGSVPLFPTPDQGLCPRTPLRLFDAHNN